MTQFLLVSVENVQAKRLTLHTCSRLPQSRSLEHISSHTGVMAALFELATAHLTVRGV